jgi:A/G-specific adenine glycosylase
MNRQSRRDIHLFRRRLLRWYDEHKRDLPWRRYRDPYRVWLSEIMLQQTRVAAVVEHYRKFVEKFSTLQSLARAPESSVLAAWSGLGYYRRARMLHRAAQEIVSKHAGQFPDTAARLCELPGVGRYTAAAIASICFGERVAVVDGNVARVLGRTMGRNLPRHEVWQFAEKLLSSSRPGDFNQAMMELGATVCLPRRPRCLVCPVFACCATRGELPASRSNTRQTKKEINYLFARRNGSVLLKRRSQDSSLLPGMWELPELAIPSDNADAWLTIRHSITTTNYVVRVIKGNVASENRGSWMGLNRIAELPLTGLARKILRLAKVI